MLSDGAKRCCPLQMEMERWGWRDGDGEMGMGPRRRPGALREGGGGGGDECVVKTNKEGGAGNMMGITTPFDLLR